MTCLIEEGILVGFFTLPRSASVTSIMFNALFSMFDVTQ